MVLMPNGVLVALKNHGWFVKGEQYEVVGVSSDGDYETAKGLVIPQAALTEGVVRWQILLTNEQTEELAQLVDRLRQNVEVGTVYGIELALGALGVWEPVRLRADELRTARGWPDKGD